MPANYTGNPAGGHRSPAVVISEVVDGDGVNAASVDVPMEKLADFTAWLQAHAAIFDDINTFSQVQKFNGVAGDDAQAAIWTEQAPVNERKLIQMSNTNHGQWRVYTKKDDDGGGSIAGRFEIVINAAWDHATTKWIPDNTAAWPTMLYITEDGTGPQLGIRRYDGVAHFSDTVGAGAQWNEEFLIDVLNAVSLDKEGFTASGTMHMTVGAYHDDDLAHALGNYVEFRKAYPSAPSSATYLSTDSSNLITNPNLAGSYTFSSFTKYGFLTTATANAGGAAAFQIEVTVQ